MATYKRLTTTKEERENEVIKKGNPKNSSITRLSEYLSQDNVKEYNQILIDKSFRNLGNTNGHYKQIFKSNDECIEECTGYFKLCDKYNMIPTISSLCLYIGMSRDTIYESINNPNKYSYSFILKNAVDTCHYMNESGAINGNINAVLYMFLSKNYYGLKDTQDISIKANNQDNTINTNTMDIIKEQIENEKRSQLLEHMEE